MNGIGLDNGRRSRTGEIIDFVNAQIERIHDVVPDEAEPVEVQKMADILDTSRGKLSTQITE